MENIVIACPQCGSNIYANPTLLFQGASFSCSNEVCDTTISISDNNNVPVNIHSQLKELKKPL